ncbi:MAG: site-2 protease family protein [Planctomycetota bacterium]
MNWWVASAWDAGPAYLVSWIFWVIFSISLHELGHGWAAIRRGDDTPIALGRMTWNPIVHMGQASLIVFAIIGIAWGSMPVNPSRLRGRHAEAFVAVAGPLMNLGLFVASAVVCGLWIAIGPKLSFVPDNVLSNIETFFWVGAFLNVALLLLNLLPVPPLDGSRIVADYVPSYRDLIYGPNGQLFGLGMLLVIFFFGGRYLFGAAMYVASVPVGLVSSLVP